MSIALRDEDDREGFRHITADEFKRLDRDSVTLVDLRDPDEALVHPVAGAVNVPFGDIGRMTQALSAIPKTKPVVVFCRTGDWSRQVCEILAERGYDAVNLDGGYEAAAGDGRAPESGAEPEPRILDVDAKGLRCPGPIAAVADALRGEPAGTRARVEATEDAFMSDIAVWAERTGNRLSSLERDGRGVIRAEIEKGDGPRAAAPTGAVADTPHDKTFVVFSGDLDKTIAVFIMANGAAAMGRRVTIFFTFWGLNILRRPGRVRTGKNPVERMLGLMMPRGTRRLGLSRMNMAGIGARMIRWIMRSKGVASLEELMDQARAHGVRLVACQMSMDIMGIRRQELIDGVELGGVATFLGAGETSDMSLFV